MALMLKKTLLLILLLLVGERALYAQDSLFYVTIPEVEEIILRYIEKNKSKSTTFYGIWHSVNDTVTIYVKQSVKYKGAVLSDFNYKLSNRFLLLNEQRTTLPLVLESDIIHSEKYLKSKIDRKTGDKILYSTKFSYECYWGKIVYILTGYQILCNELE